MIESPTVLEYKSPVGMNLFQDSVALALSAFSNSVYKFQKLIVG